MKAGDKLLKQLGNLKNMDVTSGLEVGMEIIKEDAVNRAPVDTGALAGSGNVITNGVNNVEIEFDVPYARYVEYGTAKMQAQPFLRPAMLWVKCL